MFMNATIQKWGNSQAVRLPKSVLETASMKGNELVQITAEKDMIVIKKIQTRKHRTLKERLDGFQGEYVFEECDTGPAVGRELF